MITCQTDGVSDIEPETTPMNAFTTDSHTDMFESESSADQPEAETQIPKTTLAVILAAGAGIRFAGEGHKLFAKLNGRALIWWAVKHALDAGFEEVAVIEGAQSLQDVIPKEASLIHNDDWEEGQARSLSVAVQYADMFGYETVVVGLGDQPYVPPTTWRHIAKAEGPIVVADFRGVNAPPVKLDASVWPLVPLDGDEGARQLLRARPELVRKLPCQGSSIDVDSIVGLDRVRRDPLYKELGKWN